MRSHKTVAKLFEATYLGHWSKSRFQVSGWGREARNLYKKNIAPHFENDDILSLSAKRVRSWHMEFAERAPVSGNRSLEVLSKMFQYAEEQEWLPQNVNPCNLVARHKERSRKRFASVEELALIGTILLREQKEFPQAVAFLQLLLFTGARPRSLERATWDQLKRVTKDGVVYGVLSFEGKMGNEELILPPQALSIIENLPKTRSGLTSNKIIGCKMPRRLWKKIKDEAGCGDLWARDFRRTFATLGFSGGLNVGTVSELLNHKSAQTTKVYAKLFDSAKLDAVSDIANKIDKLFAKTG